MKMVLSFENLCVILLKNKNTHAVRFVQMFPSNPKTAASLLFFCGRSVVDFA